MTTVAQLVAALREFPPQTPVLVRGYAGGLDDVREIERTAVMVDYNKHQGFVYFGDHREPNEPTELIGQEIVEAISLKGEGD
jgi:hypothetical protein